MKNNIKENAKNLLKSCTDNKVLFERRKYSILVPLIIFFLSIFMVSVPSYLSSNNVSKEDIMKNFPGIQEPMEKLLTYSLDCTVQNAKLVCSETADMINEPVNVYGISADGKEYVMYTYTIMANQNVVPSTEVTYSEKRETDNLILLLKNFIKIRYVARDYVNEKVTTYEIIGDYTKFEGYDFKQMSEYLINNPDEVETTVTNFVHNTYLSTLDTKLIVDLGSSLFSFILFVLVSCIILKGPTLFKRKKGFKLIECFKISLTSSLPALVFASIAYLFGKIDFVLIYGSIYLVRLIFIYVNYILSTKNNIFAQLYNQTGEERFRF